MKRRLVVLSVAVVAVFSGATVAPAPAHVNLGPASIAKTCHAGYRHAVIGGNEKCLHGGEFCAIRYQNQYRRYGYYCDPSTRRLRRR